VKYDPGVRYHVDKFGKSREEVAAKLDRLKDGTRELLSDVDKKKQMYKELKLKKRSVTTLIERNQMA
jgi:hypothetical protein